MEKLAGVATPVTFAVTVNAPAIKLAVNAGVVVASPFEPVVAMVLSDPAKEPLAPEAGAVKVTVTLETAFPPESLTLATSALYAVDMTAVCGLVTWVTEDAAPALFVNENAAGIETVDTVALIV